MQSGAERPRGVCLCTRPIMTEEQLLLRLRNGDRQAFELIYREYAPRLRAYCLNITKSQEDTQDLVQEAFAVLWEKRDTVHTGVAAFLFATLKNQLISLFRRRLHEPQYEDYVEYVNDIRLSTFREPMLYDEYRQTISQIINGLSEQQRTVFVLHRLQGLSHKQIAAQLQLSEQTTRNLLSLALKEIRQQLQNWIPK